MDRIMVHRNCQGKAMKRRFHRENCVMMQWVSRCALLAGIAALTTAGCSTPVSRTTFSRLVSPEAFEERHDAAIDGFMAIQPPSYDTLVRRKWKNDKVRYSDWLEEERRRSLARRDRVQEIIDRQERFFKEYLRMRRKADQANQ